MTSHQKILLSLSRLPRGVRFTSLGRINRPLPELQADLLTTRCAFLEVHAPDGVVRGLAPQDLPTLREPLLATDRPAFLIGFTADQHAALPMYDPRPNLYAALEADEEMTASPDYQPRFLPPVLLRSHLHAIRTHPLYPDDYAHRLSEMDAAIASAPDAITAGKIRHFRAAAVKYLVAAPKGQPGGKLWTTDADFSGESATAMPREVLPYPAFEEPEVPMAEFPLALPANENVPIPHPPVDTAPAGNVASTAVAVPIGQFTLAL
jgi:hypothetical protein